VIKNAPKTSQGWSLKQGLAAQYAAQAGLDPNLGVAAGEAAWDVLKALRDAVDEPDSERRRKLVRRTNALLVRSSLGRHGELVKSIGTQQQQLRQAELDAPFRALEIRNNTLHGTPYPTTQTSITKSKSGGFSFGL
jgi:hypothetical protein